jgi:L-amino acid N-acyltransferase YncA
VTADAALRRDVPGKAPIAVRAMTGDDWPAVRAIYEAGIATGNATFETAVPSWRRWDAGHLPGHRLVAVVPGLVGDVAGDVEDAADGPGDTVVGWAALSPVSDRCVYAGVAEVSVYVDPAHHGHGVGSTLMVALLERAEEGGIWTVQSQIFPENAASLAIHRRCGFRLVGRRERLGRMDGSWRDVVLLERRSPTIT